MFKFYLILFLLFPVFSFGQNQEFPINQETKDIEYSAVIKVDSSLTKDKLYSLAQEWFISSFRTQFDALQIKDPSSGIIMGNGSIQIKQPTPYFNGHISFTIKIQVNDGEYRYWINNLEHFTYSGLMNGGKLKNDNPDPKPAYMSLKTWGKIKETAKAEIPGIILSLKQKIQNTGK